MIVLLDTNILLDVLQQREPHFAAAQRVWKLVEEKSIEGHVSAISFNNVFYIARKQVGADKAKTALQSVRKIFQVAPLDTQIIDDAINSQAADFEDAIQAAAAKRVHADHLVTRNVRDFSLTGINAVTADELLAILVV